MSSLGPQPKKQKRGPSKLRASTPAAGEQQHELVDVVRTAVPDANTPGQNSLADQPAAAGSPKAVKEEVEDDDDDDDIEDELLHPRKPVNTEAERALLSTFTEDQLQRYEAFRRAHFQKSAMKRYIQSLLGQTIPESSAIVVAGAAKLFVGEMTEKAREVMDDWGDVGPIRPEHLHEAWRRHSQGPTAFPAPDYKKALFR
ncbi:transcription initiation factor TFIID subunit 11 [Gaertneriomyces sp. JEL0708]|nr:transcription initiation factor TFIID subunit 11 [Gaertneriomyces sp. JEL0708]